MNQSTLFVGDSHAKTLASQEKEQDLQEKGQDFGGNSIDLSKKSNRSTSSRKMSQPYALEDWTKFSGRSLRSGMMQNGTVYPLQPLALLTAGTEFGSWPTPTAVWRPMEGNVRILREKVIAGELSREEAAGIVGKDVFEAQGRVPKMLFPTPSTGAALCGGTGNFQTLKKMQSFGIISEEERKNLSQGDGGKANPDLMEWLMGFPIGWTELNN